MEYNRRDYEFSQRKKKRIKERANYRCEWPEYQCSNIGEVVDHVTSIWIGLRLGMDRQTITSLDNGMYLCSKHDSYKRDVLEPEAMRSIAQVTGRTQDYLWVINHFFRKIA